MSNLESTRVMRLPAVMEAVGLKKTAIYKRMGKGTFPQPVRITSRNVAWRQCEIVGWLEQREKEEAIDA